MGMSNLDLVHTLFGSAFRISRWYIPGHDGIDLPAKVGTPVRAIASGTVSYASDARLDSNAKAHWAQGGGNVVNIDIGGSKTTQYAHLDSIKVRSGTFVQKGQVIGTVGSTGGNASGPGHPGDNFGAANAHVHFGLWDHRSNRMINPTAFLLTVARSGPTPSIDAADSIPITGGGGDQEQQFLARLKGLGISTDPTHRFTDDEARRIVTSFYPSTSGSLYDSLVKTYTGTTVGSWADKVRAGVTTSTTPDPLASLAATLGAFGDIAGKLSDPGTWARILALFAGVAIFGVGAFGVLRATATTPAT